MASCRPSSEVEHIHGKDGVTGSIPVGGSRIFSDKSEKLSTPKIPVAMESGSHRLQSFMYETEEFARGEQVDSRTDFHNRIERGDKAVTALYADTELRRLVIDNEDDPELDQLIDELYDVLKGEVFVPIQNAIKTWGWSEAVEREKEGSMAQFITCAAEVGTHRDSVRTLEIPDASFSIEDVMRRLEAVWAKFAEASVDFAEEDHKSLLKQHLNTISSGKEALHLTKNPLVTIVQQVKTASRRAVHKNFYWFLNSVHHSVLMQEWMQKSLEKDYGPLLQVKPTPKKREQKKKMPKQETSHVESTKWGKFLKHFDNVELQNLSKYLTGRLIYENYLRTLLAQVEQLGGNMDDMVNALFREKNIVIGHVDRILRQRAKARRETVFS